LAVIIDGNSISTVQAADTVGTQAIAPRSGLLVTITANNVNLRSGAGTNFASLGQVNAGDEALAIGHGPSNGFIQVVMRTGQNAHRSGFVHQDFIRFVNHR